MLQITERTIHINNMCTVAKHLILQFRNRSFHMIQRKPGTISITLCNKNHICVHQRIKIFTFFQQCPINDTAVEPRPADACAFIRTLNFNVHHTSISVHRPDIQFDRTFGGTFVFDLRFCMLNLDVFPL